MAIEEIEANEDGGLQCRKCEVFPCICRDIKDAESVPETVVADEIASSYVLFCENHDIMSNDAMKWCRRCGVVFSEAGDERDLSQSEIAQAHSEDHYISNSINTVEIGTEHRYRSGYSKGAGVELSNPFAKDFQRRRIGENATVLTPGLGYHVGNSMHLSGYWTFDEKKGKLVYKVDYSLDKWNEMIKAEVHRELASLKRPVTAVELGNVAIVTKHVYSRFILGPAVDVSKYMVMLNSNIVSLNREQRAEIEKRFEAAVLELARVITTRAGYLTPEGEPQQQVTKKSKIKSRI